MPTKGRGPGTQAWEPELFAAGRSAVCRQGPGRVGSSRRGAGRTGQSFKRARPGDVWTTRANGDRQGLRGSPHQASAARHPLCPGYPARSSPFPLHPGSSCVPSHSLPVRSLEPELLLPRTPHPFPASAPSVGVPLQVQAPGPSPHPRQSASTHPPPSSPEVPPAEGLRCPVGRSRGAGESARQGAGVDARGWPHLLQLLRTMVTNPGMCLCWRDRASPGPGTANRVGG